MKIKLTRISEPASSRSLANFEQFSVDLTYACTVPKYMVEQSLEKVLRFKVGKVEGAVWSLNMVICELCDRSRKSEND